MSTKSKQYKFGNQCTQHGFILSHKSDDKQYITKLFNFFLHKDNILECQKFTWHEHITIRNSESYKAC